MAEVGILRKFKDSYTVPSQTGHVLFPICLFLYNVITLS
jgi:hypothetical protein